MTIEEFADGWMAERGIAWGAASREDVVRLLQELLALPRYTEDVGEAWAQLEALRLSNPAAQIQVTTEDGYWNCVIDDGARSVTSSADHAGRAISKALDHWREAAA